MDQLDSINQLILICISNHRSVRQMANAVLLSPSGVMNRLKVLEQWGFCVSTPKEARSRKLTEKGEKYVKIVNDNIATKERSRS
jgi:DNA-binding MarR family transcriptional regulator